MCVQQLLMMQHGGGVEMSNVPEDEYKQYGMVFQEFQMTARISIFFGKLAVLLLYLRAFFPQGTYRTTFWWVIHVVIWLNLLYSIALILVVVLQCVPHGLPWGNSCIDQWLLLVLSSIINIISDLTILVIPMASVWKLQMSRKKKRAMWALFAFATLAPLASIARLAYQIPTASDEDKTVIYTVVALLATAEQVVAIIVGNAPVASAWFMRRQNLRKNMALPGGSSNPPTSRGRKRRRPGGAPDPFRVTECTGFDLESQENLSSSTFVPSKSATGSQDGEAWAWPLDGYTPATGTVTVTTHDVTKPRSSLYR